MQAFVRTLALLVISFGIGGAVGFADGHRVATAALTKTQLEATTASLARERLARAAADQAMERLATTETANARLTQERNDALHAATTGRRCFDVRALRVLDGAPGIRVADLPAAPAAGPHAQGGAAAAAPDAQGGAAAAAADPQDLSSTDTDVGAWILGAGLAYESCRARLNGLIDYLSTTTRPAVSPLDAKEAP